MARYTEEQKNTIEYLINRGKVVHKKLELAEFGDETTTLQNELNNIKVELSDAINAEALFKAHLRAAKEHLDAADEIRTRWCGGDVE